MGRLVGGKLRERAGKAVPLAPQVYCCKSCGLDLVRHSDIVAKTFHGRHGRAYLVDFMTNIREGGAEQRMLMTGLHTVRDVFCVGCEASVGWGYVDAHNPREAYKIDRFVVEKAYLARRAARHAPAEAASATSSLLGREAE